MSDSYQFIVDVQDERLDVLIARKIEEVSRSQARTLIVEGGVIIASGISPKPSLKLPIGSSVTVTIAPETTEDIEPENIPLEILHEDDDLLAVNKPAGLTVHPGAGQKNGTLVNALVYRGINLSDTGGGFRPGIVHRLDKDTSGVILIAKNNRIHRHLSNQLKERTTIKRYLALVWGVPDPSSAVIDAPIGRHPISRKKMTVISTGRPSVTSFHTIKSSNGFSLLDVKPSTGRTHQIRVHMSYNHTPIVGDQVYAPNRPRLVPRQFLHASSIQFTHPSMKSIMEINAPLPSDLENALMELLND